MATKATTPETEAPAEAANEAAPALTDAQVAALDRDGDGAAGGSLSKAEKIARAAKQSARHADRAVAEQPDVTVKVLKAGDGKISMGEHVGGIGELHYEKGEIFSVARDVAEALEERGFVEIQG